MDARRGVTLAEQLAASSNLRDLLKLRDDGEGEGDGPPPAARGRRRTLLDAIRGAGADDDEGGGDQPPPAVLRAPGGTTAPREERVSLMALLERTDQRWTDGGGGRWTRSDAGEAEEGVGGRCCVCVARGKGAAFVPCGHTFCRACARELSAGRGRCPLCNAAIRDVLNLF